ncbi:MAG: glycosyltransferase family 2 protein [Clostridiales bacterium]|nr:glycosyltransferase family 2 protein [Clostridiales bacterium]
MHQTSKIAILVAVRDGESYLPEQLDSLIGQTDSDWVAYIHDDGSADGTQTILESYAARDPDRFVLLDGAPTGSAKTNYFYLLRNVDAPLYMCCDQDDVWLPDKIEKTLREMRIAQRRSAERMAQENLSVKDIYAGEKKREGMPSGNTDAGNPTELPCLVYTDLRVVDESLAEVSGSMNLYQKLNCEDTRINHVLVQNVVTGCTMMINRRLRDMVLSLKDPDKIVMHDWWAALIAAQFGELRYLNDPTILYRQHGENDTGAKNISLFWYLREVFFQGKDKKDSLEMMRKQAEALAETFPVEKDSVVAVYAGIHTLSKPGRLRVYRKYKLTSKPLSRQLAILLFC